MVLQIHAAAEAVLVARLGAMQADEQRVLAPRRVVWVLRLLQVDEVLVGDGVEVAAAHAEEDARLRLRQRHRYLVARELEEGLLLWEEELLDGNVGVFA